MDRQRIENAKTTSALDDVFGARCLTMGGECWILAPPDLPPLVDDDDSLVWRVRRLDSKIKRTLYLNSLAGNMQSGRRHWSGRTMLSTRDRGRLNVAVTAYTFVWVIIYFPLETYVTLSIAGLRGLLYAAYIMNVIGMGLMLCGAVSASRRQRVAPALLATGWSWTAATFWRATADRYWWVSLGHSLYAGPIELWLGPILTALACGGLAGSLLLVFRSACQATSPTGTSDSCRDTD